MAVKHLISPGIGFSPGHVKFIVTRGLSPISFLGNAAQTAVKAPKRVHIVTPTTLNREYRNELTQLVKSTETNTPEIVTKMPTKETLSEREFRLYFDGTNFWIFTKRNNILYKTQLNPV